MKRFIITAIALGVLFPVAAQASQVLPAKAITDTAKPTKAAVHRMQREKIVKGKTTGIVKSGAVKSGKSATHNPLRRAHKHLVH